ncbi:hypothetical protein CR513_27617, partial [Mucuna pruriens]
MELSWWIKSLEFDFDHWSLQDITAIFKELGSSHMRERTFKGYLASSKWDANKLSSPIKLSNMEEFGIIEEVKNKNRRSTLKVMLLVVVERDRNENYSPIVIVVMEAETKDF